ncbi:MAG: OsmC family protein [Candidatus Thorarchaeota archaeon]
MSEEPRIFEQRIRWVGDRKGQITASGMPTIISGGLNQTGDERHHTPEDLLVAAVGSCFMNSFLTFLEKMRLEVVSFEATCTGTLEKVDRSYEVTKVHIRARVVINDEEIRPRIERALELGAKYCFVANSLKATVSHENEIVVEAE